MKLTQDKKLYEPDNEIGPLGGFRASYQNRGYQTAISFVKEKRTAIDVGAHIGIFSRRMSKDFQQVHCFEPQPVLNDCWDINCKGLSNLKLYKNCLSNKTGQAQMKCYEANSGASTLHFDPNKKFMNRKHHQFIIDVNLQTLDSYNFTDVDFIKIDAEKHELQVLQGAVNTINTYKPVIYVELHGKPEQVRAKDPAYQFLLSLNYFETQYLGSWNYLFIDDSIWNHLFIDN
jgi:FkbM family methyltransferase